MSQNALSLGFARVARPAVGLVALVLAGTAIFWRPAHVSSHGSPAKQQPAAAISAPQQPGDDSTELYKRVQPIFSENCYRCHGAGNSRGGLRMDTAAGLMHGGKNGVVVVPGHPEQSLLIKLIRHEGPAGDPMLMPPRKKLSDADIATVTGWIKAGAMMPPDPSE